MADPGDNESRSGALHGLSSLGTRAASATMRPFAKPVSAAAEAGIGLQRRAIDRLLDSGDLEQLLASPRLHALVRQVVESDGARMLVDELFDSGLIDRFLDRLLTSDALWHLIDVIAGSPAVRAAISQQGLGFADQIGAEVRARSRRGDDRLERAAQRLIGRKPADANPDPADPSAKSADTGAEPAGTSAEPADASP
jgi:hypothetical protein